MALDLLNGKIKVYNYEKSPVVFPSQYNTNGVFIRGREEDEEYVIERVHFDDIESENTKSDLFRVGRLRFSPQEEDEVYKKLGIEDKDNLVTNKELLEILKKDDMENIKYISKLNSNTLLLRMKKMLFSMERNGNIPPHQISAVVNERLNELKYGGKRNPNSEINKILEADNKKHEESKLKEQVSELTKIVEKLQKESEEKDKTIQDSTNALSEMLAMVQQLKQENSQPKEEVKQTATRKPIGRPKKTTE